MRLKYKTALVSGGGKDIGEAISLALATEGCAVGVAGRYLDALEQTTARICADGGQASAWICDVGDPASIERALAAFDEKSPQLGILVNNAV